MTSRTNFVKYLYSNKNAHLLSEILRPLHPQAWPWEGPNFSYDIWVHTAIAYIMNFGIQATLMASSTNFVYIVIGSN